MRAFCTEADLPPLADAFDWAREHGVQLRLDIAYADEVDILGAGWSEAALVYHEDRPPFAVHADQDPAAEWSVVRDEAQHMLERLEDTGDTAWRRTVSDRLTHAQLLVACVLADDVDDAGLLAASTLLEFFCERCHGVLQADGEGFYAAGELVVEMA